MKKLVLLFIVISFSLPSFSQVEDYSIIRNDMISYFSEQINTEAYYSPRKLVIDHWKILENGEMIYSFPSAYLFDQDEFNTIYPNTNIFGDSAFVDLEGNTTFYNCRDRQYTFNKYNGEAQEWIIHEENGAKLIGTYQNPIYIEILDGIWDTVAIIKTKVEDMTGVIIEDNYYHDQEIIISKKYGIAEHFQINEFDGLFSYKLAPAFHLIGINKAVEVYGMIDYYRYLIIDLEPGFEVHSKIENSDYEMIHRIKRVIQKDVDYAETTYTFQICDYHPTADTTIHSEEIESYSYLMDLRESIPAIDQEDNNSYWAFNYFFKEPWENTNQRYFEFQIWETQETGNINDREIWSFDTWGDLGMGTFAKYQFIEKIGKTCSDKGEYLMADEIQYYKTESEEWGTPYTHDCANAAGTDDIQENQIIIYPNPAEDLIEFSCGASQIISFSILNIQGQKVGERVVEGQTSNLSLDISKLKNGIYIIEAITKDDEKHLIKMIKK